MPTVHKIHSAKANTRRILCGVGIFFLAVLIGILFCEGGVPTRLDFDEGMLDPDLFSSSLRTVLWWCCLINLALIVSLWLSVGFWIGEDLAPRGEEPNARRPRLVTVGGSALLAMIALWFIDAPRLSHSLWNDEIWSMSESIHGTCQVDYKPGADGRAVPEINWEPVGWQYTVWGYDSTNQHYLLSLAAKSSLSIWRNATGAEAWEFDEVALRLIPFLCALGGLGAWAIFFHRLGFGGAAMLVPWLLVLNPWYQEHATGMRGYAMVFLLMPLALICCTAALRCGTWRAWTGFALVQFLLIYAWPGIFVVMLPFNLILGLLAWKGEARANRLDQVKRWAIASLSTGILLLPLLGPAFFQIGPYLESEVPRADMGWPWLRNLASFLFVGTGWPNVPGYTALGGVHVTGEHLFQRHPILFTGGASVALGCTVAGCVCLWRKWRSIALLILIGLTLGLVLSYLRSTLGEDPDIFLFQWYFVFLLPPLCGLASIGIVALAAWLGSRIGEIRPAWTAGVSIGCAVTIIAGYASLALPRTLSLRQGSMDPRRESARAVRGERGLLDPGNRQILTAHVLRSALIYDPYGWKVTVASNDSEPEGALPGLTQLMRMADTLELELYVNVGLPSAAREERPDIMGLIDDSGYFKLHSQHPGLEPRFERAVYRYSGGLFDFDFDNPK